jgi:hypothetical protein
MENNNYHFGYHDTVTGKTHVGYVKDGEMKFKVSLLDRLERWFTITFCNDWVQVDKCLCPLVHEYIWGTESKFVGIVKLFKRRYTNEFKAVWGSPSDLRELDFDYACALLRHRTNREPNLKIQE